MADSSVPSGIVASAAAAATKRALLVPRPSVRRKPAVQAVKSATPIASSHPIEWASGSYGSPTAFFSPAATATTPSRRP